MAWVEQYSLALPGLSSSSSSSNNPSSSSSSSRYDPFTALVSSLPPPYPTRPTAPRTTSSSNTTATYSSISTVTSSSSSYYPYSSLMPPPPLPRKRKHDRERSHSPVPESSASPSSYGGDLDYDPSRASGSRAPRPKRIQSKPVAPAPSSSASGAMSLPDNRSVPTGPNGRPMSREQLRKANHSLIERRRREKINSALTDLRSMVPGLGEEGGKGGEFKLEVLERTVQHMRELKKQVADLEDRLVDMQRVSESDEMDIDDEPPSRSPRRSSYGGRSSHASGSNNSSVAAWRSQSRVSQSSRSSLPRSNSHRSNSHTAYHHSPVAPHHYHSEHPSPRKPASQSTPPSPSMTPPHHMSAPMSPDPNETEAETDLPPALTLAHRSHNGSDNTDSSGRTISPNPHPPSIASLLASSAQSHRNNTMGSSTRLHGQPSPNIYLPFPTPSPTSPFLTYHGGSAASTASSATGPPEPSPFMAPLQNISLFGGALDTPGAFDGDRKQPSPPDLAMPPPGVSHSHPRAGDLGAEEAANLLLAFSSPETLRPSKTGSTPLMSALSMPPGQRGNRNLDSEDFSLDGGPAKSGTSPTSHSFSSHHLSTGYKAPRQGKTARDILRM